MKLAGGPKDLKSGLMLNFAGISWLFWNTNLAGKQNKTKQKPTKKLKTNPIVSNGERENRKQAANAYQRVGAFS